MCMVYQINHTCRFCDAIVDVEYYTTRYCDAALWGHACNVGRQINGCYNPKDSRCENSNVCPGEKKNSKVKREGK